MGTLFVLLLALALLIAAIGFAASDLPGERYACAGVALLALCGFIAHTGLLS